MKKYKKILEVIMSKQTAVEWFYKKLKNYKSLNLTDKLIQNLYKETIQMEKEQIEDAYVQGMLDMKEGEVVIGLPYYDNTYGDKK